MSSQTQVRRTAGCCIVLPILLVMAAGPDRSAAADGDAAARELGRLGPNELDEVSGSAASRRQPDILWMHNDGDARFVYAVRTSGHVVARVRVFAETRDLEDIAIGPGPKDDIDYLYLGDIGDNEEDRPAVRVFRFAEPILRRDADGEIAAAEVEEFRLTYPDGRHNAEALMVDPVTGDLLIVTKEKKRARLYAAHAGSLKDKSPAALEKAADVNCRYVSGGDISPDGSRIILRRESRGWLWLRRGGESIAAALERSPQEIPVRFANQGPNGESIAFHPDGRGYYTVSEGLGEPICLFSLESAAGEPLR